MGSLRRIAELLARTVAACALVYVVFDRLLGGAVLRGLTAAAQGVLRLIDRPVVLTSLSSDGDRVVIASYLSGLQRPLATWSAENLPIFLVATLGLALAAPASGARRRLETVLLAVLVSVPTMLLTAVVQLQVTAANAVRTELGLRLYGTRTESLLAAANQGIGVAMLLVPAAVFAFAYVRFREDIRGARAGSVASAPLSRSARARDAGQQARIRGLAAATGIEISLLGALAAIGAAAIDPRPGLVRVAEQNPGSSRAYVALASYDALAGLHRPRPPGRTGAARGRHQPRD